MKKDELHARVLYLYQILRHYSDSEHPLTTQQILKIMDEKYHNRFTEYLCRIMWKS